LNEPGQEQEEKPKKAHNWFFENYVPLIFIVVIVVLAFVLINPIFNNLVGEKAPNFSVTGTEGEKFTLSENSGKVIVLDMMSTTCSACINEMKHLNEIFTRYSPDEVIIVSIDVQRSDSNNDLRSFKTEYGNNWTFARDTDDVANKYKVKYTPTTVIIDKDGIIRYHTTGVVSVTKLSHEIEMLL
jgi:peroxiredoxin